MSKRKKRRKRKTSRALVSNDTTKPANLSRGESRSAGKNHRLAVAIGLLVCGLVAFVLHHSSTERKLPAHAEGTKVAVTQTTASEGLSVPRLYSQALLTDSLVVDDLDDNKGAWPSEEFNERASAQLKALAKILEHPHELSDQVCRAFSDEHFRPSHLRPSSLSQVFDKGQWSIWRPKSSATDSPDQTASDLTSQLGPSVLATVLQELMEPFREASEIHVAFKITRVDLEPDTATTVAIVQVDGRLPDGYRQLNSEWECLWQRVSSEQHSEETEASEALPRLLSITTRLEKYEEAMYHGAERPLFADSTRRVMADIRTFDAQFAQDSTYWLSRLENAYGVDLISHHGIAVGDVNGDGMEDLYVCQPGGLPNRLFVAQPSGTAIDQANEWGVDYCDFTVSALWIDLDNDGDQDLVALINAEAVFLENDGKRLVPGERHAIQANPTGLTAADFDNDGLVDIYVLNKDAAPPGSDSRGVFGTPMPYHDANNGGSNMLLRNKGSLHFQDVTKEVGLQQNNQRFSFAGAWQDFDLDGDPDLYVANDFGRNNLYRNDNGHFVDVAAEAGVEDISAGMSVSWGDYNNDGLPDLYVSNMFSSAGNRVTYQRNYGSQRDERDLTAIRRHARGNSLFENRGDGTFRDVSVEANVSLGRWAWASNFIDFNNDGWQDLLVANGFITNEIVDDL